MTKDQLKLQIPVGVRDLLPSEALRKRSLENSFEKIFRTWGYNEVITPTFEFYDALSIGRGAEEDAQLYKFIDRQGHILTLRPDMTTPIARLASSKMRDWARPMRFFYMANVFSYEDPQAGRQREFYQSGIELIGEGSPYADAEVIAIAVELLKQSGLRNFQLSIGHVDILYGMMEELGLPEDQVGRVKAAISNRNYVGLQELLDEFNVPESDKERFMRIITTHGEKDIIQEARKLARNEKTLRALDILDKVYEALEAYEITANVELNFSILRGLDYYTGIVFEGFSSYIGFPILGGGRYDNLMGQFGGTCPATGFALGMERLLLSLEREGSTPEVAAEPDYVVLYREDQAAAAFKKARELRAEGYVVVTQQATGNEKDVETNRGKTVVVI
ncbi:MAG: ATP phosphoribosyltransferase regulatory subunit [Thermincola sp.]|nr:ATP phosphoribosyltransferase regulatory subunit [Thermincola sp.]MDT3704461.1 ATP phosphoribosyltransferase regulatory subunit [Thermincola sp.]